MIFPQHVRPSPSCPKRCDSECWHWVSLKAMHVPFQQSSLCNASKHRDHDVEESSRECPAIPTCWGRMNTSDLSLADIVLEEYYYISHAHGYLLPFPH